jgi:2-dehydro-3-deoxyphosphogluconate aldolase/(4S)-4-hydroxy-2-oxoglutarate aldolase
MVIDPQSRLREVLERERTFAIIRGPNPEASLAAACALLDEHIRVIEISLTSSRALEVLAKIASAAHDEALIGAGTVRSADQLDAALSAGAGFVIAPALTEGIYAAVARGVAALPGAFTATELDNAARAGFRAVKLFPASLGGPRYVRALREPFPELGLIPVGGVSIESVPSYLQAGATAVGLGSPLLGDATSGGSLSALRDRARALRAAIAAAPCATAGRRP